MVALSASAQVSFTVQVPPRVVQGQKFALTYRLRNAQGSNIKAPEIAGCTYLYGPSVSTSQSTQIINGQMSSSMTCDYTYYYRADKAGKCVVGEASIQANGKTLKTASTSFTIAEGNDRQSQGNGQQQQQRGYDPVDIYDADTQQSDRRVGASDVFVRIVLSKSTAYEQEAVECEIKLYTKYGISSFIPTRQPAFDNFLIEELDVSNQTNIEEAYNGQTYMTAVLKKCILFPQKTGKLTINSGNYDVTVIQYDRISMGLFSVQQPREREIKINSNSTSLNVVPLPEPRPAGFTGAVGNFTAESHLVGNNFKSGDPGSLIVTIKGTGNIKYLKDPEIDFPTQFEVYTPTSNVNASVSGNNVTGEMTVDYTFVPQTSGDFTIPALPFSYFNPSTRQYTTLELPSYNLKVAKGANRSTSTEGQSDIDAQLKDIRYIDLSAPDSLATSHELVVFKWWFWMIPVVLLLGLATVVIAARRSVKLNADVTNRKLAKANKVARGRLKAAQAAIKSGNSETFYTEMLKALWGYLSDKLSIPVSQLSRGNIAEELSRKGYSQEVVDQAIALIDECETAKYAPVSSGEQLDNTYNEGCRIIDQIERTKRNTKK